LNERVPLFFFTVDGKDYRWPRKNPMRVLVIRGRQELVCPYYVHVLHAYTPQIQNSHPRTTHAGMARTLYAVSLSIALWPCGGSATACDPDRLPPQRSVTVHVMETQVGAAELLAFTA
jgi:hypothetical protein